MTSPQPAPPVRTTEASLDRIQRLLDFAFASRACFICGLAAWCQHREPEVELAYLGVQP